MVRTCSRCRKEESIEQPFFGGVCVDCARIIDEAARPKKTAIPPVPERKPPHEPPAPPIPPAAPRITSGSWSPVWAVFGGILTILGGITFLVSLDMDTTVQASGSTYVGDRVHNSGLLQMQLIGCIAGLITSSAGLVVAALARLPGGK